LKVTANFPVDRAASATSLEDAHRRHSRLRLEDLAKSSRVAFKLTEPEEVAELALEGIRAGRFWILPESEAGDERVRARMEGILARRNPVLPD